MTTSFDQDGQVRAALKRIFRDHGREGLDKVDVVARAVPGDSLDERLTRAAAECGVAGMLDARIAAGFEVDAAIRAVVLHMCGRTGLELIGCDWIVYEYALAIGLVSEYPTVSGNIPTPAAEIDDARADDIRADDIRADEAKAEEKAPAGASGRSVAPDLGVLAEAEGSPMIPGQPVHEPRIQDRPTPPSGPPVSPGGPLAEPVGRDQAEAPASERVVAPSAPQVPAYPPMPPINYQADEAPDPYAGPPAPGYPGSPPGGYPASPPGGYPGSPPGGYTDTSPAGYPGGPSTYPPAQPEAPSTYPASPPGGYPGYAPPPPGGGFPGGYADASPGGYPPPTGGYPPPTGGYPPPSGGGYAGAPAQPMSPGGGPMADQSAASSGAPSHAQEVVRREMRRGVLAVNAADRMRQGRKERVEVGIARTSESAPEMVASLTAVPRLSAEVNTADYMQLQLVGEGFAITALSPPQQLVVPTARWDFDVVPLSAGAQSLSVIGTCWFTVDGQERAMAVPAFVRMVDVEVDNAYRIKRALAGNWQWIIGTILGLGGSIAAWIALFG